VGAAHRGHWHRHREEVNSPVDIRDIRREDLPVVLELLQELANYEHLEHQMQADLPKLEALMFAEDALVYGALAWENDKAVGLVLYYFNASTFLGRRGLFIEDIYVPQPYRRQGIGKALFNHMMMIANAQNCARMEWTALDWNESALAFYRQRGANIEADWRIARLELNNSTQDN